MKTFLDIMDKVFEERNRQVAKWGTEEALVDSFGGDLRAYFDRKTAILAEEFGEAATDINDRNWGHLEEELVQVTAVAAAMLEGLAYATRPRQATLWPPIGTRAA